MSFNALSLTKLGIGFGALAVASIGLLRFTVAEPLGIIITANRRMLICRARC